MYLRLSAWPSLSINHDRVLTAVQRLLSMCRQTVNPVEVPSDNPSYCSFLWILLVCLFPLSFTALFSLLSLSLFNQSSQSFSKFHCLLQLPKPHLLFYLSLFVIIAAHSTSHHRTIQRITLQCTILTSPAAPTAMFSASYITSILCNPLYNVVFSKIPCLLANEILAYTMSWCGTFHFVTSVFSPTSSHPINTFQYQASGAGPAHTH